jgi:hypothetical protein
MYKKVTIGATSIVGWLMAAAALIPIAAKTIQSGSGVTVHGPEKWLAIAGIAIGGVTQIGRYLQSYKGISQKVEVKITTVLGWVVGLGGLWPVLEKSYSEGSQALHSPEKYAVIGAIVSTVITQVARMVSAANSTPNI